MDIVKELNFSAAKAHQEGKCKKCGSIFGDMVFYWLDADHNEVYCVPCGKKHLEDVKDEEN